MSTAHNPQCFAAHLGPWAIDPNFLTQAVSAIKAGLWQNVGTHKAHHVTVAGDQIPDPSSEGEIAYTLTSAGTAVISLQGAMMKMRSKFGGVSTVSARQSIRMALADQSVGAILLAIDSPGGSVAGTQALADEIRAADAVKPVLCHIEDLGASAGYWVASQARKVNANRSALVGSLGVYGVIEDSSGKAQAEGVKVHVISTGAHKGAFVDGAPVTAPQLAEYQRVIDGFNLLFQQAVTSGRGLNQDQINSLFDGRVHLANDAKSLGLIDTIQSFDQSVAEADAMAKAANGASQRRLELARARSK